MIIKTLLSKKNSVLTFLFLPLMTLFLFVLYYKYSMTTKQVFDVLYQQVISEKEFLIKNYVSSVRDRIGEDFVQRLRGSESLRQVYADELALIRTKDLRYLYMLYKDEDGKYRYLLDTTLEGEEAAEFDQKFDPVTDAWDEAGLTKVTQVRRQRELQSLWVSTVVPVIIGDRVAAYVGADFSYEEYFKIKKIVSPLKDIYFYASIFMVILLVSAYIQFILYLQSQKKSYIDPLTQIFNRQYLIEFFKTADISQYHLLIIDMDYFKSVNDTYGHDVGDDVIIQTVNRIRKNIRSKDVFVRYGGEEFLILLRRDDALGLQSTARRIKDVVSETNIVSQHHHIPMSVSIGINPYPELAKNIDEAIKIADEQLYIAKTSGRNCIRIHEENDSDQSNRSKRLSDVHAAMEEGRIRLAYQPIHDVTGDGLKKYEVLLRMIDEHGILVFPKDFLPAIAHTSVYNKLTHFILQNVLERLGENQDIELSVNIDLQDLFNEDIMQIIITLLSQSPELARRITFEILEHEEIIDFEQIQTHIQRLRAFGCKIALDDFGSGYANFKYLLYLGIDILKIDGSLIRDIDQNENAQIIVKTIVNFSNEIGVATVAEQVETKEEYDKVHHLEIHSIQGYYLGRPRFEIPE